MRIRLIRLLFSIVITAMFSILVSCNQERELIEINGTTMGTIYSVKLNVSGFDEKVPQLEKEIETILQGINGQMSTWDEQSALSTLNRHNSTDWMEIPTDLYKVISASLEISELTRGALDITVGPLVNLWGFGPEGKEPVIPDENTIQSLLNCTGFRLVEINAESGRLRKKCPDLYIDLSAIAKGFAVDEIARFLDTRGIKNYLVEIGGEIQAHGLNPAGKPWQIGLEKPVSDEFAIQRILPLSNKGMATSGGYRNFRIIDGVHYSHTINPQTGKPVSHNLAAVTIIHSSTMMADGYATALLVMGPEHGVEFAEEMNLGALFVIREKDGFSEKMTSTFKKLIPNE